MTHNNNDALRMGIVVCFLALALLLPSSLPGCDMSAFVQSDFAARCQLLLDLCEKATISRRVAHPDMTKHTGNLSREWVRFFLAHGKAATRPPSLSFIASAAWETGINDLGMSIAAVTRGEINVPEYELLRFKIGLLKNTKELAVAQNALLQAPDTASGSFTVTSSVQWLEKEFIGPGAVIAEQLQQNPELLARLETSASEYYAAAARIDALAASEPAQVIETFSRNLKEAAKADLQFWQRLFFCN